MLNFIFQKTNDVQERFLDFYLFQDGWLRASEPNVVKHESSAFLSLIVKQFKYYVSCVSVPWLRICCGTRWYLVISLVPMNVKTTKPALPVKLVFPGLDAVSEMSSLFIFDALMSAWL